MSGEKLTGHEYVSLWELGEVGSIIGFHGPQSSWHSKSFAPPLWGIRGPIWHMGQTNKSSICPCIFLPCIKTPAGLVWSSNVCFMDEGQQPPVVMLGETLTHWHINSWTKINEWITASKQQQGPPGITKPQLTSAWTCQTLFRGIIFLCNKAKNVGIVAVTWCSRWLPTK